MTEEEIGRIRSACERLSWARVFVFSVASAHRTLPIYHVYGWACDEVRGSDEVHAAAVGIWRVLRGKSGASWAELGSRIEAAIREGESDLDRINNREEFGLLESLASESISSAMFALNGCMNYSRSDLFNAAMSALEIDSIQAEEEVEREGSVEVISWNGPRDHYRQQVRDLEELSSFDESDEIQIFDRIWNRVEFEGLPFMEKMRSLIA